MPGLLSELPQRPALKIGEQAGHEPRRGVVRLDPLESAAKQGEYLVRGPVPSGAV
jgi:hypothetical protein